ncbi:MAG: 30S ribosomal protein S19e [Nitrosopumilaceae archaeon]|nr:30S ribosomal protein S19e [Nitrosopumilaceae archaeon]
MVKVYDVPADLLIDKLSSILKEEEILLPKWVPFVKTSSHKKRPPHENNWWYTRCASILRKIYLYGPISINDLRSIYGGNRAIRYSTSNHKDASGSIIRIIVYNLEKLEYVRKTKRGRMISSSGMKKLDRLSANILNQLCETNPSLKIYTK